MSISNYAVYTETDPPVLLRVGSINTLMVPYQAGAGERVVITETAVDPLTSRAVIDDPAYTGIYTPETIVTIVPKVLNAIVVTPKVHNGTIINDTTFLANGVDTVIFTGIGTAAKFDIRMPENMGITDVIDAVITDGTALITTIVPGYYHIDIDDGVTTSYKATIHAV